MENIYLLTNFKCLLLIKQQNGKNQALLHDNKSAEKSRKLPKQAAPNGKLRLKKQNKQK